MNIKHLIKNTNNEDRLPFEPSSSEPKSIKDTPDSDPESIKDTPEQKAKKRIVSEIARKGGGNKDELSELSYNELVQKAKAAGVSTALIYQMSRDSGMDLPQINSYQNSLEAKARELGLDPINYLNQDNSVSLAKLQKAVNQRERQIESDAKKQAKALERQQKREQQKAAKKEQSQLNAQKRQELVNEYERKKQEVQTLINNIPDQDKRAQAQEQFNNQLAENAQMEMNTGTLRDAMIPNLNIVMNSIDENYATSNFEDIQERLKDETTEADDSVVDAGSGEDDILDFDDMEPIETHESDEDEGKTQEELGLDELPDAEPDTPKPIEDKKPTEPTEDKTAEALNNLKEGIDRMTGTLGAKLDKLKKEDPPKPEKTEEEKFKEWQTQQKHNADAAAVLAKISPVEERESALKKITDAPFNIVGKTLKQGKNTATGGIRVVNAILGHIGEIMTSKPGTAIGPKKKEAKQQAA